MNATDQVGEGDDHLRLIKSTILNTFPNVTGAMTLTHTQLNDAALKSVENTFTANQLLANNIRLTGRNAADTFSAWLTGLGTDDRIRIGDNNAELDGAICYLPTGTIWEHNIGGVTSAQFVDRASGSLLIADAAGALGFAAATHKAQSFTAVQTFNEIINFPSGSIVRPVGNSTQLYFHGIANTLRWRIGTTGAASDDFIIYDQRSGQSIIEIDDADSSVVATSPWAFLNVEATVADLGLTQKKIGFRNPTALTVASNRTTQQADEGKVLNCNTAGITVTLADLDVYTTYRIINRSGGNITINAAGPNTMEWLAGTGAPTYGGTRTLAGGGVAEIYHLSKGGITNLFGNGLS